MHHALCALCVCARVRVCWCVRARVRARVFCVCVWICVFCVCVWMSLHVSGSVQSAACVLGSSAWGWSQLLHVNIVCPLNNATAEFCAEQV